MNRRYGNRITVDAELVELVVLHRQLADRVDFVNTKDKRLAALHQHCSNIAVGCGNTGRHIDHEHDNVCRLDSSLRLLAHISEHHVIHARLDTAGVNESQRSAVPLDIVVDTVARNAGSILYDRDPRARYLIKERRLSHIRSADNCNYGLAHLFDLAARNGGIPFSDNFV